MFRKDELAGKIVVESSGRSLGKAKDIAFGLDGSVALIVAADDGSEIQIGMDRIAGVAEYIVVRREQTGAPAAAPSSAPASPIPPPRPGSAIPLPAAPAQAAVGPSVCRNCGAQLRAGAKFCTKCGTPV